MMRRDAERVRDETSGIGPGSSGRRDGVRTGRGTSHNTIPGEEEEEIRTCPSPILTVTITEVNDIDQVPTPNMESAAPSTGTPDPGPRRSSWIADQGTRPDYTNKTRERAMVTREIVTEPENLKEAES